MIRPALTWQRLRELRRLPPAERLLLVWAAVWLLAVDLGLRTLGFTRLRRLLGRGAGRAPESTAQASWWPEAETIARSVGRAARHHLYPMTCLTRSLVLWRLLARRGIPSELQIGVRKDDRSILAHAWVECAGRPVAEPQDVGHRFATVGLPAS